MTETAFKQFRYLFIPTFLFFFLGRYYILYFLISQKIFLKIKVVVVLTESFVFENLEVS